MTTVRRKNGKVSNYSMQLPENISFEIGKAHELLRQDSHINYGCRCAIYRAFGPRREKGGFGQENYKFGHLCRVELNKLSFLKVGERWKQLWPEDRFGAEVIEQTDLAINGMLSQEKAIELDDSLWQRLNSMDNYLEKDFTQSQREEHRAAIYAGFSALNVFRSALYDIEFPDFVDYSLSNEASDPWSCESAHWAADAFALHLPGSDAYFAKLHEFWTWWLDEAIPASYSAIHTE